MEPKGSNSFHKSLPLAPILSQSNPIHALLLKEPILIYACVTSNLFPTGFPTKTVYTLLPIKVKLQGR